MSNLPCNGCWWIEGGRCFQDKLLDVAGLEKMPRRLQGDPVSGLEITDELITACLNRGVHQRKSAVYGRLFSYLKDAGIEVTTLSDEVANAAAARQG